MLHFTIEVVRDLKTSFMNTVASEESQGQI